MDENVVC